MLKLSKYYSKLFSANVYKLNKVSQSFISHTHTPTLMLSFAFYSVRSKYSIGSSGIISKLLAKM